MQEANERFKVCESEVDKVFSGEAVTATFKQADVTPAASHSEPRKLRLTRLWKCNLNGIAANILVAPVNGKPRMLVVNGFKAITEIGLDGVVGESHSGNLTEKELITNLRTAVGRDGKRTFAAFGPWQQRIRFFDDNLRPTVIYPEDALENPHPGITDVELADLLGDGHVNAYVGFGGVVGVKSVSLEGKPLASCRAIFNIGRVTAGPPDAMHHRQLYCVTDGANVAILDPKLQVSDSTKLAGDGILEGLLQADLTADGRVTWCELLRHPDARQPVAGQYTAIGLNVRGESIWKYDLPFGSIRTVEPIVVGRILPGTASQWILPGCDGSIHILAADGTPIDRFNYGAKSTAWPPSRSTASRCCSSVRQTVSKRCAWSSGSSVPVWKHGILCPSCWSPGFSRLFHRNCRLKPGLQRLRRSEPCLHSDSLQSYRICCQPLSCYAPPQRRQKKPVSTWFGAQKAIGTVPWNCKTGG